MNKNKVKFTNCRYCNELFRIESNRNIFCSLKCRFLSDIDKIDIYSCWNWTGHKDKDGYGRFKFHYKEYGAHRVSYELYIKEIENNLYVLHSCDNPSCCNPNHLTLGTAYDNALDRDTKGRGGAAFGEKNGMSKLEDDKIIIIRNDNRKQIEIAKDFKISLQTVSRIKNYKRRFNK